MTSVASLPHLTTSWLAGSTPTRVAGVCAGSWLLQPFSQRAELEDLGVQQLPDGAPIRLRRNGRQRKAVGLYYSVKSSKHLPYESALELQDFWRAEASTTVLSSWSQPFTLHYSLAGERRRYTPDRADRLADGRLRVVEVKHQAPTAPAELARYSAIEELLRQRGVSFELRTRDAIQEEPRATAYKLIQRHRRTYVSAEDAARVTRRLHQAPLSLGSLQDQLGRPAQALAILCALMVRRIVDIDIASGLREGSIVSVVA